MRSSDIRSTFLDFFTSRDHQVLPSGTLIPSDPTLLLANAGMNQFKPYFLGEQVPEHRRAVTVQKCVRTTDIDNVGRTTRHATCFEMLGNFSFGDYFKPETIGWAWEILTGEFGLDPRRLWITVYEEDDEARRLWRRLGVPASRIQRLGMADNYWSMGVPGPCGPNSDVTYDRGPGFGREGGPAVNSERYLEIWGLVFMTYLRGEDDGRAGYPILGELPTRNIDTGLGLDRLAAILQDVDTVCETDLLAPTLQTLQDLAGRSYPGRDGGEVSVSFRVVTEHIRSAAFLIASGVLPARDGRGYVLRRLLRRTLHHTRALGLEDPVLSTLAGTVVDTLGSAWPELEHHRDVIARAVVAEEEAFARTLRQGSKVLRTAIDTARADRSHRLSGSTAFTLHDTYGFPVDLTVDAARAAGLGVDEEAFRVLLDEQRQQGRQAARARVGAAVVREDTYRRIATRHGHTDFVGYDTTSAEARLLALVQDGRPADQAGEGDEVEVVLDRSPFYAEAGGQVGDTGTLRTPDGAELRILDTRNGPGGLRVHAARVVRGEVAPGAAAEAVVDDHRRAAIARSHSATHVLHAVVRRLLGEHALQRGSRVEPGRLRFDFAHPGPLGPDRLAEIQEQVDRHLLDDPEVRIWHTGRAQAEAAGATALFGESYGDEVRVVDIGDFSRELCGGTHVAHGAGAGPVRLLGESSIGAGLRRVEALTGADALRHHDRERTLLAELSALLKVRPEEAPGRLRQRLDTLMQAERELERLRSAEIAATAERLAGRIETVGEGRMLAEVAGRLPGGDLSAAELGALAGEVLRRGRRGAGRAGIVILAADAGGKAVLAACVDDALAAGGVRARDLLTAAAAVVGGGAGGEGTRAQAGGRHPERLPEALSVAATTAREILTAHR